MVVWPLGGSGSKQRTNLGLTCPIGPIRFHPSPSFRLRIVIGIFPSHIAFCQSKASDAGSNDHDREIVRNIGFWRDRQSKTHLIARQSSTARTTRARSEIHRSASVEPSSDGVQHLRQIRRKNLHRQALNYAESRASMINGIA